MRVALLLSLLLLSCGEDDNNDWVEKISLDPGPPEIDYEQPVDKLQTFIDEFKKDCGSYGRDLSRFSTLESVKFGDPSTDEEPNRVGVCNWWKHDGDVYKTEIIVSPLKSHILLRGLMYHELGHCILGLPHTSDTTMMSPNLLSPYYYEDNWNNLVKQLCTM